MAKYKGTEKGDERLEVVEEALSKSEKFIENNQKLITITVLVLVAIVLGYFGLNKYYLEPREKEAQLQIFMAEKYFESDSLNKALYGDANNPGFLDIVDEFGSTKTGNLAKYYAGLSYLKLGEYNEAITYLQNFKGKDLIISALAIGATADAYVELNDNAKAADLYLKAAKKSNNELTKPMMLFKAGRAYELNGNYKKATELYESIQKEYPTSTEGRNIDKFLSRAKSLSGN
ncbi:MAG: tetratricopeptide repeat protein [Bacteroidetes bacterium HGW-Bacteroidetes-1]|jgi:tetratricopeptide (TPR) repeat protein|nr:MAG: tetratricopeptide repeat protein [Bacteroidetes bacterium HGW-Bacteroidetes-1]